MKPKIAAASNKNIWRHIFKFTLLGKQAVEKSSKKTLHLEPKDY